MDNGCLSGVLFNPFFNIVRVHITYFYFITQKVDLGLSESKCPSEDECDCSNYVIILFWLGLKTNLMILTLNMENVR